MNLIQQLQKKPKPTLSHIESFEDFTAIIDGEGQDYINLRLEYDETKVPSGGSEVTGATAQMLIRASKTKEAAGRHFHAKARQSLGLEPTDEKYLRAAKLAGRGRDSLSSFQNDDDEEEEEEEEEETVEDLMKSAAFQKKKTIKKGSKEYPDHYGAIGLAVERYLATTEQIKENFQEYSMKLHPDKCGIAGADEEGKEAIEQRYKAVAIAYEVLSDDNRRREYDSVDAPKHDLPTSVKAGKTWFTTFIPAFQKLERWSEVKGGHVICEDEDAPYEDVKKMYVSWTKFKSWREFPHDQENDLESANDRYHKRQMQKENETKRKEKKKEESVKLRAFFEAAENLDPRVIKEKERKAAEREAKKAEKSGSGGKGGGSEVENEAAAAEAKAAAEAAAADAKAAAAAAKKKKEAEKKEMQKTRKAMRAIRDEAEGAPEEFDLDQLMLKLDISGIKVLLDECSGKSAAESGAILKAAVEKGA